MEATQVGCSRLVLGDAASKRATASWQLLFTDTAGHAAAAAGRTSNSHMMEALSVPTFRFALVSDDASLCCPKETIIESYQFFLPCVLPRPALVGHREFLLHHLPRGDAVSSERESQEVSKKNTAP